MQVEHPCIVCDDDQGEEPEESIEDVGVGERTEGSLDLLKQFRNHGFALGLSVLWVREVPPQMANLCISKGVMVVRPAADSSNATIYNCRSQFADISGEVAALAEIAWIA